MESQNIRNKRLAKNTVILYLRMLLTTIVGLYTSRIVLQNLGIVDYGVYNVVGGVVVMFSFMQTALGNATSRFITVSLGKDSLEETQKVYSTTKFLHVCLSLLILIIAETIGLCFFNNYLNIPETTKNAAIWAYQLSVLTTVIAVMSVPDNSLIIAHEDMDSFAYISIYDSIIKLVIAYLLVMFSSSRLIVYAVALCIVQLSVRLMYYIYCKKKYKESKLIFHFDKELARKIAVFSIYIILPGFGATACAQGLNVLLNIFAGPAANAARGLAVQVQAFMTKFTQSFQQAVSPQITKLCAIGEMEQMRNLITKSAKFSFFIMAIPFIPLFFSIDFVLSLWLVEVPDYTVEFCRYTLIITLLSTIDYPFLIGITAEGNIRKIYTLGGILSTMVVPFAYIALRMGFPIICVYIVHLIIHIVCILLEIILGGKMLSYGFIKVIKDLFVPIFSSVSLGIIIALSITSILPSESLISFLISSTIMSLLASIVIYFVGLTNSEKKFVRGKLFVLCKKMNRS